MTEEEIIEVLKINVEDGVAFHFLAEEIQDWVKKHIHEVVIFNGTDDNKSEHWVNIINRIAPLTEHSVVALRDDYELKGGRWVDFDINEDGNFKVSNKYNTNIVFSWFQWQDVIRKFPELTGFGGWQYGDDYNNWVSEPRVYRTTSFSFVNSYENGDSRNVRPATPKKIRFWMEVEK